MKCRAYTLLEVLIVIAIIVILIAALMPALQKAAEKGRGVRCAGNLRQLHTAAMNFSIDQGHFPLSASYELPGRDGKWYQDGTGWVDWYKYTPGNTSPGGMGGDDLRTYWWGDKGTNCVVKGTLYSYARDWAIYVCPTFALKRIYDRDNRVGSRAVRSYLMNSAVSYKNVLHIGKASRILLFADAALCDRLRIRNETPPSGRQVFYTGLKGSAPGGYDWNNWNNFVNWDWSDTARHQHYRQLDGELMGSGTNATGLVLEGTGDYHEGKGNAVFLDGHVRRIKPTDTLPACVGDYGEY